MGRIHRRRPASQGYPGHSALALLHDDVPASEGKSNVELSGDARGVAWASWGANFLPACTSNPQQECVRDTRRRVRLPAP